MRSKRNRFVRYILCFIIASIFITSSLYFAEEDKTDFTDVPDSHWGHQQIYTLRDLGITQGIGENQFGLGREISRSEFLTYLVRLMNWEIITPAQGSFEDNKDSTAWYYAMVETALKNGVIKPEALCRPNDPITREEMAVMLVRGLGYDELGTQMAKEPCDFTDVTDNKGYITLAKDFGIITGVDKINFAPKSTAKREEAAAMMVRMNDKLRMPLEEVHGFYAISSYSQIGYIPSLSSVSFGWGQVQWDEKIGEVIFNTSRTNGNDFAIPEGFTEPVNMAKEKNIPTQFMVFAQDRQVVTGEGTTSLMSLIFNNREVQTKLIGELVNQVNETASQGSTTSFDGLVIDFEALRGEEKKQGFNNFLKQLKDELNKTGKKLYVAVNPAMAPGQPYYDGYDYKTIGTLADRVILMAHDYYSKQLTQSEMETGYTMTPLTPIDQVHYSLKAITDENSGVEDSSKILIQMSMDTVQWKLKDGKVINQIPYHPSFDVVKKKIAEGAKVVYGSSSKNSYITFTDETDGTENIIWYEDEKSVQDKLDLARMFGIYKTSLWRLGNIPDDIWNCVIENK